MGGNGKERKTDWTNQRIRRLNYVPRVRLNSGNKTTFRLCEYFLSKNRFKHPAFAHGGRGQGVLMTTGAQYN